MRLGPVSCCQDQARALPARHALDLLTGQVFVDTKVSQMLANLRGSDRADSHPRLQRLHVLVIILYQLHHVWRHLLQEHHRLPVRFLGPPPVLRHLIPEFVASAHLPPHHLGDPPPPLHGGLVLVRHRQSGQLGHLFVPSHVEAVLDVHQRSLLQGCLQVVHGVLGNIGDPQVVVLPHFTHTFCRLQLSHQKLQHGGLTCAVGPNKRHT
mmetsp:Transcript_442/g.610  ORF Transcript_442/g.610 Transcript_442/m.610 type:complete len:209 (-) Transcript_442:3176-3802(-)